MKKNTFNAVPSLPLRLSRNTRRVPYLDDFTSTHFFNSLKFSSNRSGWIPDSGWDLSWAFSTSFESLDKAKDDAFSPWNDNNKDDDNNDNNDGDDTQL